MKIAPTELAEISKVIKVADLVKITNLVIETGRIRGVDAENTVFILQTENIPTFGFGSIGLNRLPEFVSRYNLSKDATNFEMDATIQANGDSPFVRAILMKGKGMKVDYRCANPMTIMAPKNVKSPFAYQFNVEPKLSVMLQQGQSAYKSDVVTFVGTDEGVTMQLSDVNNDKMEVEVADDCEILEYDGMPSSVKFSHRYPVRVLLPLLKAPNAVLTIAINTAGVARINVDGFNVHIMAVQ